VTIYFYRHHDDTASKLEQERERRISSSKSLSRLTGEKRRAEVLVTDQKLVEGVLKTTLLFVEYAPDGIPSPEEFYGSTASSPTSTPAHPVRSNLVKENDPLRGAQHRSFQKRIYGDTQKPDDASRSTSPTKFAAVYRGAEPRVSDSNRSSGRILKLYDDETYRKTRGVRVAMGQGLGHVRKGQALHPHPPTDGGLNLTSEPLKGHLHRSAQRTSRDVSPRSIPNHI